MIELIEKLLGINDAPYCLTIPRKEENEGLLLLGDPGTGKSQIIHQLLTVSTVAFALRLSFVTTPPANLPSAISIPAATSF